MRRLLILLCVALLAGCIAMAEDVEPTNTVQPAYTVEVPSLDDDAGIELSGYFGGDIAAAAAEIGDMEFSAGEEYAENYMSDAVALHGDGGVVRFIDLREGDMGDTLCGVKNGMPRSEVEALMDGCPLMWTYDEEMAWLIRADAQDQLKDEILVVFYEEKGSVCGAWYRISGM